MNNHIEYFFLKKIYNLPDDIIMIIKDYIPKKYLIFISKENYISYHSLTKIMIKNYENYIRDMIRRDNDFVFQFIIEENYKIWYDIKQYKYKNMIFKNYLYFLINYCIENDCNNIPHVHICFLFHGFSAGRTSAMFGVWAALAALKTIPEGWGLRTTFWNIFRGRLGRQHPKNRR